MREGAIMAQLIATMAAAQPPAATEQENSMPRSMRWGPASGSRSQALPLVSATCSQAWPAKTFT
jgi:hypothetical protein